MPAGHMATDDVYINMFFLQQAERKENIMRKFRSALAVLTAATMSMALMTGCSSDSSSTETETESVVSSDADAADDADADSDTEYAEDVQAIIDRGVLHVGVKNAVIGFGYEDTVTGEWSGMEIEIAKKIAEYLGVEYEFTAVTAATRTELLDSGDIDCVLATFTITDERKESWDFSTPYYTDYVTVLVEDSSGITSLADLVGTTVGVSSGSTSAKSLVSAMIDAGYISGDNFDADTFDPSTWTEDISFAQYDDYPTISTALSAGEVDAFCVDKSILAIYNTEGRSYIEEEFAAQDYGVATTKGSGLSELVDELINEWLEDGTIEGFITENGLD